MFRAFYAHHQEAELYWCSIWYRHSQYNSTSWWWTYNARNM